MTVNCNRIGRRAFIAFEGVSDNLHAVIFANAELMGGKIVHGQFVFEGQPSTLLQFDFPNTWNAIVFVKNWQRTEWSPDPEVFGGQFYVWFRRTYSESSVATFMAATIAAAESLYGHGDEAWTK